MDRWTLLACVLDFVLCCALITCGFYIRAFWETLNR